MQDSQTGMAPDHPWSGKAHNLPDLFAHSSLIAMYGAGRAHWFILAEPALLRLPHGIPMQFTAGITKASPLLMEMPAMHFNHDGNRPLLPFNPLFHQLIKNDFKRLNKIVLFVSMLALPLLISSAD